MHSELLQIIYYDFGYTIYKSEFSVVFQVFMRYFYSVDEIWEINGIFAFFIQKQVDIEVIRIIWIVCIVWIICMVFAFQFSKEPSLLMEFD